MRRREFISGLAGTVALPLVASAQQPDRMRRIGVFMGLASDDPESHARLTAFRQRLQELGWTDGSNLQIDYRWAEGDTARARAYAAELLALKPSIVVANSAPVTRAVRDLTSTIPIVFVQLNDPVGQGFVDSLSRPGRNITGFLNFEPAIGRKWVETLKEITSAISRVGVIFNPATAARGAGGAVYLDPIHSAASVLGLESLAIPISNSTDIDNVADPLLPDGGAVVLPDVFNTVNRGAITAALNRQRIPAIYPYRYFVKSGGLISYGIDTSVLYGRAAVYVDRILRGQLPSDLPVQAPTRFELVINLGTAKAIGLTPSQALLARADEVIE